jgi:uncharacterized protein (TIRG00374 family)
LRGVRDGRRGSPKFTRLEGLIRQDYLRLAAGFVVSAVFIAVTIGSVDVAQVIDSIGDMRPELVMAAVLVAIAEVTVRSVRWRWLLAPVASVSISASFMFICIGHFANTFLPLRLGDVARAYLAGTRFRADRLTVFGTVVVERILDGGLLLGVVLAATVAGLAIAGLPGAAVIVFAGAGAAFLVSTALLYRPILRWLSPRAPRLHDYVKALAGSLASVRARRSLSLIVLATVLSLLGAAAILELVLYAAGVSVPLWAAAITISAMTLSTAIPAAPAAIGTYEFAGTALLMAFGVSPHAALAAVIIVHLVATLPPAVVGLAAILVLHVDVLSLRNARGSANRAPVGMADTS